MNNHWLQDPDDRFHEECGVVGIAGHAEASNLAYLALYALQHRGKESCGIATRDGKRVHVHKGMGLVADCFEQATLEGLPGRHAIGHVRYSTAGSSALRDAQPFLASSGSIDIAVAHNGNLTNALAIRGELEGYGSIFQSMGDSEVFVHLYARARGSVEDRVSDVLSRVRGAYSLVMMVDDVLVAARDPHGFRPLSLGRLDGAWVVASESCAFDLIGAEFERDVEPGEVVTIRRGRLKTMQPLPKTSERFCVFEHIYFSRPDSVVYGAGVYHVRKQLGRALAAEHPVEADLVVPVLDSGAVAALGYADASGIPYEPALMRNHYVGRTFIEPEQSIRLFGAKVKHNPIRSVVQGKRLVVVDDSIVRGTTLDKLTTLFRSAGAREVHVRVSAPPSTGPCYYGVDTPSYAELIAANHTVEEMREMMGPDSLAFLSLDALREVEASMKHGFCDACFSGDYPVPVAAEDTDRAQLPLFRSDASGGSPGASDDE
ncbi:MAG: amidophosphoribosyltransferase [Deltaproteobacteria bacterium]|nr:amidophosphoribosyltransferase [Deltaproteobacteria bacterium]